MAWAANSLLNVLVRWWMWRRVKRDGRPRISYKHFHEIIDCSSDSWFGDVPVCCNNSQHLNSTRMDRRCSKTRGGIGCSPAHKKGSIFHGIRKNTGLYYFTRYLSPSPLPHGTWNSRTSFELMGWKHLHVLILRTGLRKLYSAICHEHLHKMPCINLNHRYISSSSTPRKRLAIAIK